MERSKGVIFTEAFKRHVVFEVESGRISKCDASRRYGILGHSTILKWCRKYGITRPKSGENNMPDKDFELMRQANEIKALKVELEDARFTNMVLDTLIDVAEEELHIPIRKKYGAKRSGK